MSDTRDHIDPPDDDTLAAEYVLGVLDNRARAGAERRMARERGFAALVEAWQLKLVPWADDIAAVQPPFDVWNRISAALPAERPARQNLWSSVMLWRWLTAGTGALALASALALFIAVNQPAPAPLMAAIDGGGHRHFVATLDRGTIAVVPAAYTADPSRVPELWLIAPNDRPRSLGVVRADTTTTIAIPPAMRALATGQSTLAISLEPPGGSTTGAPTGPVIAQGKLTAL